VQSLRKVMAILSNTPLKWNQIVPENFQFPTWICLEKVDLDTRPLRLLILVAANDDATSCG